MTRTSRLLTSALLLFVVAETGPAAAADSPIFEDVTEQTGLDFVHFNGMTGELYFPEMTGAGAALVDYDGDGDLDLYLVQGAMLGPGETLADAVVPPVGPTPPSDRLYRSDLTVGPGGERRVRFTDVTRRAGLAGATGHGMGVATGDYDGDGHVDLYVSEYGPNRLWRNRGDGTFEDVTAKAGVADPGWSVGASFVDYDADGDLDLYVVNYVAFDVAKNPRCYAPSSRRDYCGPAAFEPQRDRLLRNRGDGTFEDATAASGIGAKAGPGLGVAAADFDGDRRVDLYVANDGAENFLWLNRGDGTFEDDALFAGVAVNRNGAMEASMGVEASDLDGDGDVDLFMTHLAGETNTLYLNRGGGAFEDRSVEAGLAPPSVPFTSFGTGALDYDRDGLLDLVVVSGAVRIIEEQARAGDPLPLRQTHQLFHNLGNGRFEEVTARAGEAFRRPGVGRGAALGDLDGDGDTDLVITHNAGPAVVLLCRAADGAPWLGLRLVGGAAGRDRLGAEVELLRAGAPALHRRVHTDGSFASAGDPRVLFGLAAGSRVEGVRVRWPDGKVERFAAPPLGAYTSLRQGAGRPEAAQARPAGGRGG